MTPLWQALAPPVPTAPFHAGARHEIVVVGAGLTGLSTALLLAQAGRDVALVEAGGIAELATGANTGKVSLLQGARLAAIRAHHPAGLVRAYVDANRDGQEWLAGVAAGAGVPVVRRTDHTYAQGAAGRGTLDAVRRAAREAGLPVRRATGLDAPFPVAGAVALDDQFTLDPLRLAVAMAHAFVSAGGTLHTGVRVRAAHAGRAPHVDTDHGPLFADRLVLATGTPITDRGLTFAKTRGQRSYAIALRVAGPVPEGTYLAVDDPVRSIRPVAAGDAPDGVAQLVVGGGGHPVGRRMPGPEVYDELARWAAEHFPDAAAVRRWSAQDYESHNLIPFVGAMPRSAGRIRFATGYAKWGLTNAPAAALRIVAELQGVRFRDRPHWMRTISTRPTVPADLARGAAQNAAVAAAAVRGWTHAERMPVPVRRPAEGQGTVAQRAGLPVGVATVDGVTRAVSAVCPHLGGVLAWNAADCSWDCPLHASRFAPDGTRIEGPARADLTLLAGDPDAS